VNQEKVIVSIQMSKSCHNGLIKTIIEVELFLNSGGMRPEFVNYLLPRQLVFEDLAPRDDEPTDL
jgi:hypothetical protein